MTAHRRGACPTWSNWARIIGACQSGYCGGRAYLGQGDTRSQIEPWLCAETSFCGGESLTGLATFYPTFQPAGWPGCAWGGRRRKWWNYPVVDWWTAEDQELSSICGRYQDPTQPLDNHHTHRTDGHGRVRHPPPTSKCSFCSQVGFCYFFVNCNYLTIRALFVPFPEYIWVYSMV